ncbi:hypothetical protein F7725_012585 [Dissostichus mawsoni]|uniref:TIL domain-containing protein n=1 Tax=Dissostichus mawsoni TaxID=36200 RepID=A0A7J5YNV4_DISMA|nr:hypothetical protein F7725_012585 [Dissostichus mawsoni]
MLCQALASYSRQCRGEGIIIKDWRKKFGCPMSCHSHYEICTSPCQPSCPFPDQKSPCPGACVEACVCDKGYVLSAGASGVVNCEKLTCASGEVCGVRDGVRGCHVKQGRCSISQVGLLTSFDGMSGVIGAQGAFQVASLCDETNTMWFLAVVCSKGASPTVDTLYVFFKETAVTVNSQHVTWLRRA